MVLSLLVLWGLFGVTLPQFSPYMFVCNYHGGLDQGDLDQGEVALSVAIEGNPAYYVPGHMYQVSISTSSDFNGLLITGLYSSTSFDSQLNPAMSFLLGGNQPGVPSHTSLGSNHMCSIVHQHMGLMPKKSSEFYWIAPPEGSGCVNFLATASLQHHVLFKDALALQLCEAGMPTEAPFRPQLAMVHSEGVILRDDFDSSQDLDYTIWSEVYGGNISNTCGTVLHGNSMVFCQPIGTRELTTVHLNTTTASVLQFALSSGHCRLGHNDYSITVSYAVNNRVDWHIIDKIRIPANAKTTIHILHLPHDARQEGVCLRFHQDRAMDSHSYEGCWALDNILVGNAAYRPETLEEDFDPIDPGNWLFFPNGAIKSQCQSDGNALFFHDHNSIGSKHQFASTHELNLLTTAPDEGLFEEHFTGSSLPSNWEFVGATMGTMCGTIHSGESVVFSGSEERKACTPFLDTTQAANLRFYFSMGSGSCDPGDSEDVEVSVQAYMAGTNNPVLLEKLAYSSYKKAQMVSMAVPPVVQTASTRFCLVQTNHQGVNRNVWAIDEVQLLPWLPQNATHYAQFSLNLNCGSDENEDSKIYFEFSTNHGKTWSLLTHQCLPGVCEGEPRAESSTYTTQDMEDGWSRITVPLPFASLTSQTRFRWRQRNQLSTAQWGIDNVYIGNDCGPAMCSGHGRCSTKGCSCDQGFTGSSCQIASSLPPTNLTESFQNFDVQEDAKFTTIRGVELGYKCGVLATGKSLVFNKEGRRELVTRELNTTEARYLQFTIRIGSHSSVGSCPAPSETDEGVLLLYTCNNGIIWNTLRHLEYDRYHKPRVELIHLPTEARQQSCRFRWWQPLHSGANQDVWALDDITIADTLYNTIWVDFSSDKDVKKAMSFHLGEVGDACGVSDALVFSGRAHNGSERYAETQSIQVGASYMIQFDLVMGCGEAYEEPHRKDKKVHLEFSKDHGLSWQHVQEKCLPGQIGCHSYHEATIFDDTKYGEWNRITVILPTNLRSPSVRFRWRQSVFAASDMWALDNIYIGEQCPDMCHGHGACVNGICRCDSGYIGQTCIPEFPLSPSIQSDFEESGLLQSDWLAVHGGGIVHNGDNACGVITSGFSLYFSQAGVRALVSHDLNTQLVNFVQFYIRLGGDGSDHTCQNVDERGEGVLLQYSNDGGITWSLLLELYYDDYRQPKFVHQILPDSAHTPSTRIRWWQPAHSGVNDDQWALDQVYIGSHNSVQTSPASFQNDDPLGHLWLTVSNGNVGSHCSSGDSALVFTGTTGDRFAVTKAMDVRNGDVIQFKIVVGCRSSFTHFSPVHLEFSQDGGMQWNEVMTPCYPSHEGSCQGSHGNYQDGSVYHMGQYAYWKLVVIEMPNKLTRGKVQFRWWQQADKFAPVFALDHVYIGPKCPGNCNGHGVCQDGQCVCDHGYQGDICEPRTQTPSGLNDQFEDTNPSASWAATTGGNKGQQCGVIKMADSLYFGSVGPREARTTGLNTTSIKIVQFYIRIGSSSLGSHCLQATNHNEAVLVQFSTDNGISWETLRVLDPVSTLQDEPIKVTINLPLNAKTPDTVFRWWQPLTSQSIPRAQWALDNVLIGANDTQSYGFEDHFESGPSDDSWYMVMGGHAKQFCNSASNTLVFDSEQGMPRYAETWDYHITMSTFLQFNLTVGCGQLAKIPLAHSVYVEYSLDMGKTWRSVAEECIPPDMGCGEYNMESVYGAVTHGDWTRVTVYLPEGAVSDSTRFRWIQPAFTPDADIWAIDDVYLGNGCPWMCSGHGSCVQGQCVCDTGYMEPFCVPRLPLSKELKDTFHGIEFSTHNWISSYGGSLGNMCGILVSDTAAVFNQPGLKMLISHDLDCTMMEYIQFTFQYGCPSNTPGNSLSSSRNNSILLQYSNNGGISWTLIEEMHYVSVLPPKFFNIELPMGAKTNATRFRFWQPSHTGNPWALDNIVIGGNTMNHGWLYEDFSDPSPSNYKWLFHPGGRVGAFCATGNQDGSSLATHSSSPVLDHSSALVFTRSAGERSVTTRDIDVDEHTVVQFKVNIGCADQTISLDPVHLQYSRDQGSTWNLLLPDCFSSNQSAGICTSHLSPSSVYYSGERQDWYRVVIPLAGLHICGTVRFRWYQGFYSHRDNPKSWALDNVYIGSKCPSHCSGHGLCLDGMHCRCDEGYGGHFCSPTSANMNFLKEAFEGKRVDSRKFTEWSGAEITDKCGTLITGTSLHFTGTGKRMLVTGNMDLTTASAMQFYIRLGCQHQTPSKQNHPILLQFSTDGGITWVTMETMAFSQGSNTPMYVALEVPYKARTNATIVRWWQPSHEGSFHDEWAIDQIFIGGHIYGQSVLEDDFASSLQRDSNQIFSLHEQNWLLSPGSVMQQVCGSGVNALYFSGNDVMRYTITADVMVTELTFLQFELAMGCLDTQRCYEVELEYSLNMGKQWQLLSDWCLPSDIDCLSYHGNSRFTADVFYGWNRIMIPLPPYTRSKATRFRWRQPSGFTPYDSWALSYVYIGSECSRMCTGHGRCNGGLCVCDIGWQGMDCSTSSRQLANQLRATFSETPRIERGRWSQITGEVLSAGCGPLASGKYLFFNGACTRSLITDDLDLSHVDHIQFYFRYGCNSVPTTRDEGVLLEYSTNGGISWNLIMELFHSEYSVSTFLSVELPNEAKHNGTRIKWWQPKHSGLNQANWAIDNIIIGGSASLPSSLNDNFETGHRGNHWMFTDNTILSKFCETEQETDRITQGVTNTLSLKGGVDPGENTTVTSTDLRLQQDSVLEFKISIGCNTSWDTPIEPIHLFYSTDYGMSWDYLIPQCLSGDPQCNGVVQPASLYYHMTGWRRVVIPLPEKLTSRAVRFRWFQHATSRPDVSQHWAIDDISIGPQCPNMCNGHGSCDYPQCICDEGFSGLSCENSVSDLPTFIKERITDGESDSSIWGLVQGGTVASPSDGCGIVSEGWSLHFSGQGLRVAETADLDLRDSSFVQYHAVIGSDSNLATCRQATGRDEGVILQYSIDGGISWHTLAELDYQQYHPARHDYLTLPASARTLATRLRWWQPIVSGKNQAQWALDDILIGGSDVNPTLLADTFDSALDETRWEFHPFGSLELHACGNSYGALYWPNERGPQYRNGYVTTQHLIVDKDYMVQFEINVGCQDSAYTCTTDHAIHLEFNTDPSSDQWTILHPPCMPDDAFNTRCDVNEYHTASVFTANKYSDWQRVTFDLPPDAISSSTRLRWIQNSAPGQYAPSWAIDEVYIGAKCLNMCNGHGRCTSSGQCQCDQGFIGDRCTPSLPLSHQLNDNFEGGISPMMWSVIRGGRLGNGCGGLVPHAHGKSLYFSQCGAREAITAEFDTTRASELMFVLQIGSSNTNPSCTVDLTSTNAENKGVLLHYTNNNGIHWHLIQSHDPQDYMRAQRVSYALPKAARGRAVRFRWWQPEHDGANTDQWAIDHVQLVMSRRNNILYPRRTYGNK